MSWITRAVVSEDNILYSILVLREHLAQVGGEHGGVWGVCIPIGVVVGEPCFSGVYSWGPEGGGTQACIRKDDDRWPSLRGRHLKELGGGVVPQRSERS